MSSTKKKLLFKVLFAFSLLFLGLVYLLLSTAKKSPPQKEKPEIVLQNLIPAQSTAEDVTRLRGKPDLTSEISGSTLLKYNIKEINDSDTYAIKNGLLHFYIQNKIKPESFTEFSKTKGEGKTFYELDDAYVWHIYPTKGIGVSTIGKDIVRLMVFEPMNDEDFEDQIGATLGLTKEPTIHEEIILEP